MEDTERVQIGSRYKNGERFRLDIKTKTGVKSATFVLFTVKTNIYQCKNCYILVLKLVYNSVKSYIYQCNNISVKETIIKCKRSFVSVSKQPARTTIGTSQTY